MKQQNIFKIRRICAYIVPFIVFLVFSILTENIGDNILNTDKLSNKYLLDLLIAVISPIVFVLVGFYIEPKNKKKTIKILSIILCVFFLFAIMGSLDKTLQLSTYLASVGSTVVTYIILYVLHFKKEKV
jgi:Mn2+/Fe2+ NRAMP family transporter